MSKASIILSRNYPTTVSKTGKHPHTSYTTNEKGAIPLNKDHLDLLLASENSYKMTVAGCGEGFIISEKNRFKDITRQIADDVEKHQEETGEFPFPMP